MTGRRSACFAGRRFERVAMDLDSWRGMDEAREVTVV